MVHFDRPHYLQTMRHIKSRDIGEDWRPDILLHKDQLADPEGLIEEAAERLATGTFRRARDVLIPKTPFFSRTGQLLDLPDRIALHAVVLAVAPRIERRLISEVYSARLARRRRTYLTLRGLDQWRRWSRTTRSRIKRGDVWLVKTDITSFFSTIHHDLLDAELQTLSASNEIRDTLTSMLNTWSPVPGVGLTQGPDAARLLGNLYLAPIDDVMARTVRHYSRYMDDVRISGTSKIEVVRALQTLEELCRRRGLVLSPGKTQLLEGAEAIRTDLSDARERAMYLLTIGNRRAATHLLRRMLRDALNDDDHLDSRNARFSLNRLRRLRNHDMLSHVVDNLDELAPVAKEVAQFLSPHISESGVLGGLTRYLSDGNALQHEHLLYFLYAMALPIPKSSIPATWITHSRARLYAVEAPPQLRGMAANVATKATDPIDISNIRDMIRATDDDYFARILVVALARADCLDRATSRYCSLRSRYLARTILYLESGGALPPLTD